MLPGAGGVAGRGGLRGPETGSAGGKKLAFEGDGGGKEHVAFNLGVSAPQQLKGLKAAIEIGEVGASAGGNGKAAVIGRGDCGKGFRLAGSECTADQEEVRPLRIYSLDNPAAGWNLMGAIEHLASASLDS